MKFKERCAGRTDPTCTRCPERLHPTRIQPQVDMCHSPKEESQTGAIVEQRKGAMIVWNRCATDINSENTNIKERGKAQIAYIADPKVTSAKPEHRIAIKVNAARPETRLLIQLAATATDGGSRGLASRRSSKRGRAPPIARDDCRQNGRPQSQNITFIAFCRILRPGGNRR